MQKNAITVLRYKFGSEYIIVCYILIKLEFDFVLFVGIIHFVLIKPIYFILYSENQCISKLDKIGIFIDMKFH